MPTHRQEVTTDANGDATLDVNLDTSFIFRNLRAYFNAERIEFFRVYSLIRLGGVTEDVGDGGRNADGGGGGGGSAFKSRPQITSGKYIASNETLRIVVQAGTNFALSKCKIAFDWEQREK